MSEFAELLIKPEAKLFSQYVSDRFGDYGLTGAAVILNGDILGLVVSCRALGIAVEHTFLRHIIVGVKGTATGMIVETPRSIPVRNIYRDSGFAEAEPGRWRLIPEDICAQVAAELIAPSRNRNGMMDG